MKRLDAWTVTDRLPRGPVGALLPAALAAILVAALAALAALAMPSPAAAADRAPAPSALSDLSSQVRSFPRAPGQGALLAPRADGIDCVAQVIACGQTLTTDITSQDCQTSDGTYFDVFFFDGVKGQTVTATMTSNAFDPFLYLFKPDPNDFVFDDNSGPGNAARIVYDIDETSPDWSLTPTPFDPFITGAYTLSLKCDDNTPPPPPPPNDGFFTDPQYPDFRFKVEITPSGGSPIDGIHLSACQEDTVCVAGAIPDRPELYIRILGPRPNGYLWPTLVRFTPSAVEVQIKQVSSGEMQTYTLDAVGPDDDLTGLQDRMGFLPQ